MRFHIPISILQDTTGENLTFSRSLRRVDPSDLETSMEINLQKLSDEEIAEIRSLAQAKSAGKFLRSFDAVMAVKTGESDFKVPSFEAFASLLSAFLRKTMVDGWIYELCEDGNFIAWAVTSVRRVEPQRNSNDSPHVELVANGFGPSDGRLRARKKTWIFHPSDVSRRSVEAILKAERLFIETPERRAAYDEQEMRFLDILRTGFARQFRITGRVHAFASRFGARNTEDAVGARVIMDVDTGRVHDHPGDIETQLYGSKSDPCYIPLPYQPIVEVFNLATHESLWVNCEHLEPYHYRPELKEKLILPEIQRDLLDILTSNTSALTGDLIEGKAAGNVILSKGIPGVGKTLTAEIYAEVCQKPLYSVHAGNLGTSPKDIAENLRTIFQRAKRWDCALLLDEADVFVMTRGRDVTQNAIVAEFLRTMEYFDGLLFMTSNRGDDIDEAILSRCAAIIHYEAPKPMLARKVWHVMAENFGADLSPDLVGQLVAAFPGIAPRDIKMLLRLTMRVSEGQGKPLDIDLFRQCAMFRGINAAEAGFEKNRKSDAS